LCPAKKRIMADLLSQSDLNALLGLAAEDEASGAADTAPGGGLSQGDLDSLLAGIADYTPATKRACPAPIQEECAAPSGESLSQDEIDRLLADFGK
jgi:hypothetical protein